jgi:hypothetical protein
MPRYAIYTRGGPVSVGRDEAGSPGTFGLQYEDSLTVRLGETDDKMEALRFAEREASQYCYGVAILDRVEQVVDCGDCILPAEQVYSSEPKYDYGKVL